MDSYHFPQGQALHLSFGAETQDTVELAQLYWPKHLSYRGFRMVVQACFIGLLLSVCHPVTNSKSNRQIFLLRRRTAQFYRCFDGSNDFVELSDNDMIFRQGAEVYRHGGCAVDLVSFDRSTATELQIPISFAIS
jgi:hypothetical protein